MSVFVSQMLPQYPKIRLISIPLCTKSFKGVSRIFQWSFVLQFYCSMNLIAATRAEGGLVIVTLQHRTILIFSGYLLQSTFLALCLCSTFCQKQRENLWKKSRKCLKGKNRRFIQEHNVIYTYTVIEFHECFQGLWKKSGVFLWCVVLLYLFIVLHI